MTETDMQNRRLGYARVSTYGQTLNAQLEQLRRISHPTARCSVGRSVGQILASIAVVALRFEARCSDPEPGPFAADSGS